MARKRAASLKRRRPVREPERRFYIYCEGTKTEPAYFRAIANRYDRVGLAVTGVGGIPETVAQRAISDARRGGGAANRRSSFEEQDQVWAVFDRNGHASFSQALTRCRQAGVHVAYSDPCFELWLALHLEDYDKPAASVHLQRRLQSLFPEYDHQRSPGPEFHDLLAGLECAQSRAMRQLRRRRGEDRPFGNPSTTVGCLTRAIRSAQEQTVHPEDLGSTRRH